MKLIQVLVFIATFIIVITVGVFLFLTPGYINCNYIMECNECRNCDDYYKQITNFSFYSILIYAGLFAIITGLFSIIILGGGITLFILELLFPKYYNFSKDQKQKKE